MPHLIEGMMLEPSPIAIALRGLCPRCGSPSLFSGLVAFEPRCRGCGLELADFNVGDGPAAFLILIVGAFVTFCAVILELAAEPPFWLHALLWLPLALVLVVGLLRLSKGLLLALEYRHHAKEARVREDP